MRHYPLRKLPQKGDCVFLYRDRIPPFLFCIARRCGETENEMKRRKRVQKVNIVFSFVGKINFLSAMQP